MAIPMSKGFRATLQKRKLEIEYSLSQNTKRIRRKLMRAMQLAVEAENGSEDAGEIMQGLIEEAEDLGMARGAITIGSGMPGKIASVLDRPEPQAHAVGLLLNAAELLDLSGRSTDAEEVRKIAIRNESATDHDKWRKVSTPTRRKTAEEMQ